MIVLQILAHALQHLGQLAMHEGNLLCRIHLQPLTGLDIPVKVVVEPMAAIRRAIEHAQVPHQGIEGSLALQEVPLASRFGAHLTPPLRNSGQRSSPSGYRSRYADKKMRLQSA